MKRISVAGVNHERTPVELRERLYFPPAELPALLKDLCALEGVAEAMVLSTCNRTEAIFAAADPEAAAPRVIALLSSRKGLAGKELAEHFYFFSGREAAGHVFRVAAGLDSMVFGENEITGQFKNAYELALKERTAGKVLLTLYRASLAAVKKIKAETGVSRGNVSVSHCAVGLAERALKGLGGKKVLVVGAGEMANSAAVAFMDKGVGSVDVVNKTRSKAVEMSRKYKGAHYEFGMLDHALENSDIILCSTSSPEPVLRTGMVERALSKRPDRELFIIDIAVPRDVEAGVKRLDRVHLYDIDDLKTMTGETMNARRSGLAAAEKMLAACVEKLEKELYVREAAALVSSIRERIYRIADEECAAMAKRKGLTGSEAEALKSVTLATVNRIIRSHMSQLKNSMGEGRPGGEGLVDAVRKAFSGL